MGAENTRFNAKVYIDVMYIEDAPLLLMVDDATHFSAAQTVVPLTTESVWETILTLWVTFYTGFPNTLVFDDGSQLRDTFAEICEIHEVEWKRSGTQDYCVLVIVEGYHEPMRRIFRDHRIDHPK